MALLRRHFIALALGALGLALATARPAAAQEAREQAAYTVDTQRVLNKIDVKIHGQFLEHIFNSVHGGLWGEMLLNGSLEPNGGGGVWQLKDNMITMAHEATDQPIFFGDPSWTDYELTLEAQKIKGAEGFLILFRAADGRYARINFGGWANKETGLEKAGGGAVGKRVPGHIEAGKWYSVRIRCEGPHFQAFLDNEKVLDVTDTERPFLKGRVGVSTWQSQASFRNIKVASLDGKVLFEGLPGKKDLLAPLPYWYRFGEAEFLDDTANPYNSRCAEKIVRTAAEGEAGLAQKPRCFRAGETYKGSVYLRGSAADGVIVRLLDDAGKPLAEKTLTGLGAEWQKFPFEFAPAATAEDGSFQIVLKGKGEVWIDQLSLFPQAALDVGGFRPDVLQAIKDLKPATIRYPGGCFASAYHWKDGVGPRDKRTYYPNEIWADRDPNQMGTDEFMDLCRRVGAQPILAINSNLGTQDTLDWLEYCNGDKSTKWGAQRAQNGHPEPYNVKLWEIDNETWHMGVERYAGVVTKFSQALRQADPSLKIIACGSYGYDDGKGSSNGWNKKLIELVAKDFDYLSIHYYNGICYAQDCVDDPRKFEKFMRDDIGSLIAKSANPKMLIYCSEWGMMNAEWRSGLYTGGILNAFERSGKLVEMACPAVWLQTVSRERPNPRWASCSILFDHRLTLMAPTAVVQKMWRDHFAPNLVALEGPEKPLNMTATTSADGKTLFLKAVNPENRAVDVTLTIKEGFAPGKATFEVAADKLAARNTLDAPTAIAPKEIPVQPAGQSVKLTFPPYSAGVLTLQAK